MPLYSGGPHGQNFNPNHDERGEFASGGGSGRGSGRRSSGKRPRGAPTRGANAPTGRAAARRLSHGLSFNDLDGIAHENGGHHLKSTSRADSFIFGSETDARGFLYDVGRAAEWDIKGVDPDQFVSSREAGAHRFVLTVGR